MGNPRTASGAIIISTDIGPKLRSYNIKLHRDISNTNNQQNVSAADVKKKILALDPDATFTGTAQAELTEHHFDLLLAHPDKIPYFIDPRPDLREDKERLFRTRAALQTMIVSHIKNNVLPFFIKIFEEAEAFRTLIKLYRKCGM